MTLRFSVIFQGMKKKQKTTKTKNKPQTNKRANKQTNKSHTKRTPYQTNKDKTTPENLEQY